MITRAPGLVTVLMFVVSSQKEVVVFFTTKRCLTLWAIMSTSGIALFGFSAIIAEVIAYQWTTAETVFKYLAVIGIFLFVVGVGIHEAQKVIRAEHTKHHK